MALFCHRFVGVYYRPRNEVHLFEKGSKHGSQGASVRILPWGDPALQDIIANDLFQQLEVCLLYILPSELIVEHQIVCDKSCIEQC
jgi:hypothetical protein